MARQTPASAPSQTPADDAAPPESPPGSAAPRDVVAVDGLLMTTGEASATIASLKAQIDAANAREAEFAEERRLRLEAEARADRIAADAEGLHRAAQLRISELERKAGVASQDKRAEHWHRVQAGREDFAAILLAQKECTLHLLQPTGLPSPPNVKVTFQLKAGERLGVPHSMAAAVLSMAPQLRYTNPPPPPKK